jgi:hypothetical protein
LPLVCSAGGRPVWRLVSSCVTRFKEADADRPALSLVAGAERLSRDRPVYAAGPMRGQRPSRLGDMTPDLYSPNGI